MIINIIINMIWSFDNEDYRYVIRLRDNREVHRINYESLSYKSLRANVVLSYTIKIITIALIMTDNMNITPYEISIVNLFVTHFIIIIIVSSSILYLIFYVYPVKCKECIGPMINNIKYYRSNLKHQHSDEIITVSKLTKPIDTNDSNDFVKNELKNLNSIV